MVYAGELLPLSHLTFSGEYAPGAGVRLCLNPAGRDPIEKAGAVCRPFRVIDGATLSFGPGPSDFLMMLFGSLVPANPSHRTCQHDKPTDGPLFAGAPHSTH